MGLLDDHLCDGPTAPLCALGVQENAHRTLGGEFGGVAVLVAPLFYEVNGQKHLWLELCPFPLNLEQTDCVDF